MSLVDMDYTVAKDDSDALAASEAVLQIYANAKWQEVFLMSVSTDFMVEKESIEYDRQGKPWLKRYTKEGFMISGNIMNPLNMNALALALGRDPDAVDTSDPTKDTLTLDALENPPRFPAKLIGHDKAGKAFEVTFASAQITSDSFSMTFANTVSETAVQLTAYEDADATLGFKTCQITREK
jgi:hypothetical protein